MDMFEVRLAEFEERLSLAFNSLFQVLDLYQCSPESGDLWYKSRRLKKEV